MAIKITVSEMLVAPYRGERANQDTRMGFALTAIREWNLANRETVAALNGEEPMEDPYYIREWAREAAEIATDPREWEDAWHYL